MTCADVWRKEINEKKKIIYHTKVNKEFATQARSN